MMKMRGWLSPMLGSMLAMACACPAARALPRVRSIRPSAVSHAAGSPFKLAHSDAHGIVPRRAARLRVAPASSPFASELCAVSCGAPSLIYHDGSVMHKVKVYIIQWEPPNPSSNGQSGTSFPALLPSYRSEVGEFIQKVAAASGTFGNVYSVDTLYGETAAGGGGEYKTEFGEVLRDEDPYPERKASTCPLPTAAETLYPPAGNPCISDGASGSEENYQLSEELFHFLQTHTSLPIGLGAMYFILTPSDVNSCSGFEGSVAACNTNYYCAYHSGFGVENSRHEVTPVIYANMPYDDVSGCETPDQPHKSPVDDEIDTLSHEHNEAITDPLGEGWFDAQGEEVADKCTYPFFDPGEDSSPSSDAYGVLLGGTPKGSSSSPGTAYNQEIAGGQFLLQREWSNAAGGCVARAPGVHPLIAVSQQGEKKLTFSGLPSTTEAGEITEYKWEFGDSQTASGGEVTHEYASTGEYEVKLKVKNDSGVSGETTAHVTSTATASVTFTPAPAITTSTVTSTAGAEAPLDRRTSAEIAKLLGLPGAGAKLAGVGAITLGHAQCPPACGVQVRLIATAGKGKRIQVGSSNETIASKSHRSITLHLTGKGMALLRKARHGLRVVAEVIVESREGASWTIKRSLTLMSGGGKAAQHRSHAVSRPRG